MAQTNNDGTIDIPLRFDTKGATKGLNNLKKAMSQAFSDGNVKKVSSQMMSLNMRIDKATRKVQDLERAQEELANQKVPTKLYQEVLDFLQEQEKEYEKLKNREYEMIQTGQNRAKSKRWKILQAQIEEYRNSVEAAREEVKYFDERYPGVGEYISGTQTDEYAELTQKLSDARSELDILNVKQDEMNSKGEENVHTALKFSDAFKEAEKNASSVLSILNKFHKSLKSTVSSVKSFFGKFKKQAASTSNSIEKQFKGMFKKVLKYALGLNSFFILWKKLKSYTLDGFETMYSSVEDVKAPLDNLSSAFNTFKNNLATAFQPLLSVVSPILVNLINLLTEATTKVATFIATLTGRQYIYKAAKANSSYADSIEDAGEAAKEANKNLADYDKLTVINSNNAASSSSGNSTDSEGTYEKVDLDVTSAASRFAEQIKEAWEKADFTGVGTIIADKLSNVLDNIPWTGIQTVAQKVGRSIGTLINGFVEFPELGAKIGNAIAQAINTGISLLDGLINTIHLNSIGTFVGTIVVNALEGIHWDTVLADAKTLGTKIAQGLNSLFDTDVLESIGRTVGNAITAGVNLWYKFVTGFHFEDLGSHIGTAINETLTKLNEVDDTGKNGWQKLGTSISKSISGITETLIEAFDTVHWDEVGQGIVDCVTAIEWGTIFEDAVELLSKIAHAIGDVFKKLKDDDEFSNLMLIAGGIITEILLAKLALKIAVAEVTSLCTALGTLFKTWLAAGGLTTAINTFAASLAGKIFLALGAAMLGWTLGQYIYDSLEKDENGDNVIDRFVADVMDFFFKTIPEKVQEIKEKIKGAWGEFKLGVGLVIDKIKDWVKDRQEDLIAAWDKTKKAAVAVKATIQAKWKKGSQKVAEAFNKLKKAKATAVATIKAKGESALNKVKSKWESLKSKTIEMKMKFASAVEDTKKWINENVFSKINSVLLKVPVLKNWVEKHPLKLAQGAVIPPNKEFMAVLGDQKQGTNIETPLNTMIEAFKTALNDGNYSNNQPIVLKLDSKVVASAVWDRQTKSYKQVVNNGGLSLVTS